MCGIVRKGFPSGDTPHSLLTVPGIAQIPESPFGSLPNEFGARMLGSSIACGVTHGLATEAAGASSVSHPLAPGLGLHLDGLLHKVVGLHDKPGARRRSGRL